MGMTVLACVGTAAASPGAFGGVNQSNNELPKFGQAIAATPLPAFGSAESGLQDFAGQAVTTTAAVVKNEAQQVISGHDVDQHQYTDLIQHYAEHHGLRFELLNAVIKHESNYQPNAVSPAGAKGLMQIMDDLIKVFNINPFDAEQNIRVGSYYLSQLLNQFDQNIPKALAAYNAGPSRVIKYNGIPPFPETQTYVNKILNEIGEQS